MCNNGHFDNITSENVCIYKHKNHRVSPLILQNLLMCETKPLRKNKKIIDKVIKELNASNKISY